MGKLRLWRGSGSGLVLPFASPPLAGATPVEMPTEEAAIVSPGAEALRLEPLVAEGEVVAEGAPLARLRHAPAICLVAPMPARVARIDLAPGRRLREIVLFRETQGDVARQSVGVQAQTPEGLAALLQGAGFWPRLRRRPFGLMPGPAERPAAILVMGCDTRPGAPDPAITLAGREAALERGLRALALLTAGPVFFCQPDARPILPPTRAADPVRIVAVGQRHPQGLAGLRLHDLCPASAERPVWDLAAEDVAALGDLLETGSLPQDRVVTVTGPVLTESRLLRCRIGADTRALSLGAIRPGPHVILVGSALDGRPAHWLGPLDRQVTVLPDAGRHGGRHWFIEALTRSSRPPPLIPTAALEQATGGAFPAMAMLRALSSGDDETATRLGALSLLEEDLALVDYVLGGEPGLRHLLRGFLDRARAEAPP